MSEKDVTTENTTSPSETKGGISTRIAAVVIAALIYGALVYVSRFAPRIFGMQITFPAAGVAPAMGIWFQGWGAIGVIIGTIISQLPAGLNPLIWIPSNLAQALGAILPAILYKKDTVKSFKDWLWFAAIGVIMTALTLLVVDWNLHLNGFVPFNVAMKTLFPVQMVGNLIWVLILGPIVLNVISPYINKAGLKFRKFF